jgi:hypothetical protein
VILSVLRVKKASFVNDLGEALYPYLICLTKDWVIALCLWVLLWLFKKITGLMPIDGWQGEFFESIHSVGTMLAYAMFVILFLWDILVLSQKEAS